MSTNEADCVPGTHLEERADVMRRDWPGSSGPDRSALLCLGGLPGSLVRLAARVGLGQKKAL